MNKKSKLFPKDKVELLCGEKYSLEQIHNRMYEMIIEFDKFCREHGLTYYLNFGTLIGAVRHQDFIPWDDDVDICMMRDDYEKLIAYSNINDEIDIVSFKNSHYYYHPYPYCNIADKNSVMVEHNTQYLTGKGIFLDVFPLDNIPADDLERKKFISKLTFWKYIKGLPQNPYRPIRGLKDIAMNVASFLLKPIDEMKIVEKIDKLANTYNNQSSDYCSHLLVGNIQSKWKKSEYAQGIKLKFRDAEFICPVEYDAILRSWYGDYMQLPPIGSQNAHHGVDVFAKKIIS